MLGAHHLGVQHLGEQFGRLCEPRSGPVAIGVAVNEVDAAAPHGLCDRDFDSLFTVDKPIVFNFHGYPWLIHRLTYNRTNHKNLHVRGYKERGNINTPMELAIENEIDRYTLAIDVIDRVSKLQSTGAHAKEKFRNMQISCRHYAHEFGIDRPEVVEWRWPF